MTTLIGCICTSGMTSGHNVGDEINITMMVDCPILNQPMSLDWTYWGPGGVLYDTDSHDWTGNASNMTKRVDFEFTTVGTHWFNATLTFLDPDGTEHTIERSMMLDVVPALVDTCGSSASDVAVDVFSYYDAYADGDTFSGMIDVVCMVQGEVYDLSWFISDAEGEVYNSTAHNLTNLNHSEPIFYDDLQEGNYTVHAMLFGANDSWSDMVSFHVSGASDNLSEAWFYDVSYGYSIDHEDDQINVTVTVNNSGEWYGDVSVLAVVDGVALADVGGHLQVENSGIQTKTWFYDISDLANNSEVCITMSFSHGDGSGSEDLDAGCTTVVHETPPSEECGVPAPTSIPMLVRSSADAMDLEVQWSFAHDLAGSDCIVTIEFDVDVTRDGAHLTTLGWGDARLPRMDVTNMASPITIQVDALQGLQPGDYHVDLAWRVVNGEHGDDQYAGTNNVTLDEPVVDQPNQVPTCTVTFAGSTITLGPASTSSTIDAAPAQDLSLTVACLDPEGDELTMVMQYWDSQTSTGSFDPASGAYIISIPAVDLLTSDLTATITWADSGANGQYAFTLSPDISSVGGVDEETASGLPGLGLAPSLLALLGAAMLLGRRED